MYLKYIQNLTAVWAGFGNAQFSSHDRSNPLLSPFRARIIACPRGPCGKTQQPLGASFFFLDQDGVHAVLLAGDLLIREQEVPRLFVVDGFKVRCRNAYATGKATIVGGGREEAYIFRLQVQKVRVGHAAMVVCAPSCRADAHLWCNWLALLWPHVRTRCLRIVLSSLRITHGNAGLERGSVTAKALSKLAATTKIAMVHISILPANQCSILLVRINLVNRKVPSRSASSPSRWILKTRQQRIDSPISHVCHKCFTKPSAHSAIPSRGWTAINDLGTASPKQKNMRPWLVLRYRKTVRELG